MLGFFIGTACLIGMIGVIRRGRYHHHGFHGHGPGLGGGGHWGRGRRGFGWFGRRGLYRLFERLETTPGQEKVIMAALSDLKDHAKEARSGMRGTASEVAEALRADGFDEDSFSAIFDGHLSRIDTLRGELVKTAAKIHEALAPEQRDRLADFLESRAKFAYAAL
jgi:Spy/CpxP family protein refolding chaperone